MTIEGAREEVLAGADNVPAPADRIANRTKMVEVEETTWVPMENGAVYTGPLSVTRSENPLYSPNAPTVGAYATITAAISDLNVRGVSGPVRFLLTDPSYTTGETFPIVVDVINPNVPTAAKTVTIKPNTGVTSAITGDAQVMTSSGYTTQTISPSTGQMQPAELPGI